MTQVTGSVESLNTTKAVLLESIYSLKSDID